MNYQSTIDTAFNGRAFSRPLFYSYPGGLRFALSGSGSGLEMVLQAIRTATPICDDVFENSDTMSVCLQSFKRDSRFAYRKLLRELRTAGIFLPKARKFWTAIRPLEHWYDDIQEERVFLAFELPKSKLQAVL